MCSEEMRLARPQILKNGFKVEMNLDLKKHNGDTAKKKTNNQTNEKIPNHRQMHRKLIFYRANSEHNYFVIDFVGAFC